MNYQKYHFCEPRKETKARIYKHGGDTKRNRRAQLFLILILPRPQLPAKKSLLESVPSTAFYYHALFCSTVLP